MKSHLRFGDLSSDAIEVSSSLRSEGSSAVGMFFNQVHRFQGLKNASRHRLIGPGEVAGSASVAFAGAVDFSEAADAGGRSNVDMAGDGDGADEVPVRVDG